jgi:hypothetical protein
MTQFSTHPGLGVQPSRQTHHASIIDGTVWTRQDHDRPYLYRRHSEVYHPLVGIGIGKNSPLTDLIIPNLSEALAPNQPPLIMPSIRLQPNTEWELPIMRNRRLDIIRLQDLDPVKPDLKVPRSIRLPVHLQDNLMPLPRQDSREIRESANRLVADRARLNPRVQLVPLQPNHGGRHPIIASAIHEIRNKLREAVS